MMSALMKMGGALIGAGVGLQISYYAAASAQMPVVLIVMLLGAVVGAIAGWQIASRLQVARH